MAAPITVPPGQARQWMAPQGMVANCPPGLEYLTQLDQVMVEQEVNLVDVLVAWECNKKFSILNNAQQQCYYAVEKSDVCMRQCCGPNRSFTIHITDITGREVFRVWREFKCCAGCCWCACLDCVAHELIVETPEGQVLGYVRQLQSGWKPHFGIYNDRRELQMEIWGPCCECQYICCTGDVRFPAYSAVDDQVVSQISKTWGGGAREIFTNADTFSVTFSVALDVKIKAVMMGAVFLIDFMYYEQPDNKSPI